MKKIVTILSLLILCGSAYSQIYTPVNPSPYGTNMNRTKSFFVLHLPERNYTTAFQTLTNDTTAQIFYNQVDSSIWAWSKTKGFFKVGNGGGGVSTNTEAYDTIIHLPDSSGFIFANKLNSNIRDTVDFIGEGGSGGIGNPNAYDSAYVPVDSPHLVIFTSTYNSAIKDTFSFEGDGEGGSGGAPYVPPVYPANHVPYSNGSTLVSGPQLTWNGTSMNIGYAGFGGTNNLLINDGRAYISATGNGMSLGTSGGFPVDASKRISFLNSGYEYGRLNTSGSGYADWKHSFDLYVQNLRIRGYSSDSTAPVTSGGTKMVVVDKNGLFSYKTEPSGGVGTLQQVLATGSTLTTNNTIVTGSTTLTIDGPAASVATLLVNNGSNLTGAIQAQSGGSTNTISGINIGVFPGTAINGGAANNATGVRGSSGSGYGGYFSNQTGGNAALFVANGGDGASATTSLLLQRTPYFGTVAAGSSNSIDFASYTAVPSVRPVLNQLISTMTNNGETTYSSAFAVTGTHLGVKYYVLEIHGDGTVKFPRGFPEYADNAAAIAAGKTANTIYRTGDFIKIVH